MTWGRQQQPETRASLNNPSVPLSAAGIVAMLGSGLTTDSGIDVSEFSAMRFAAVWRCVSLLSGTVAQLPLRIYTMQGDSRVEVDNPLLDAPYPGMTPFEFWETIVAHQLLWGNAYILKVPNGLNEIVRLLPIGPWSVKPQRLLDATGSPTGAKQYILNTKPDAPLTDDEIIHLPGLSYDGIKGLSPIQHVRNAIGAGLAAEGYASRLFSSGSLMSGILTTESELREEQAQALKTRWQQRVTGLARAHEVAVLDRGLKFQPISMSPEDAQFLETRKFAVTDIARFFGVPPHLVGDLDKTSSWGAGIAEQSLGLHRYTLAPWLVRNEQRITLGLLPDGQHARFDTTDLLRGDAAGQWAMAATARTIGAMSTNEVRHDFGLPPISGGDDYAPVGQPPPAPGIAPDTGKSPGGV